MTISPLISCIMPTTPARAKLAAEAVECYARQTYPRRELLIDSGDGTIGAKRNRLISQARGQVIAHWDDDDLSSPHRLATQCAHLISSKAELTGYRSMLFANCDTREAWRYSSPVRSYAIGSSMMYWRDVAIARPFKDTSQCEDNEFLFRQPLLRVVTQPGDRAMIARIHRDNTVPKVIVGECWVSISWEEIDHAIKSWVLR